MIPVVDGLLTRFAVSKPIVSSYAEVSGFWGTWMHGVGIPIGIAFNLLLFLIGFTKTIDIDVLNMCWWTGAWAYSYSWTGSVWYGLFWELVAVAFTVKMADISAPYDQKMWGLPPNISLAHMHSRATMVIGWPVALTLKKIMPGFKADPDAIHKKLGLYGDPLVITTAIIFALELGTRFPDFVGILGGTVAASAALYMVPRCIAVLTGGVTDIANALRPKLVKNERFKDAMIGLDAYIAVGAPSIAIVAILAMLIVVIITMFNPYIGIIAINYLFWLGPAQQCLNICDEDIVIGTIALVINELILLMGLTYCAEAVTYSLIQWGVEVPAGVLLSVEADNFSIFNTLQLFIARTLGIAIPEVA
jgi:PTS system galactitol-specific IIC component